MASVFNICLVKAENEQTLVYDSENNYFYFEREFNLDNSFAFTDYDVLNDNETIEASHFKTIVIDSDDKLETSDIPSGVLKDNVSQVIDDSRAYTYSYNLLNDTEVYFVGKIKLKINDEINEYVFYTNEDQINENTNYYIFKENNTGELMLPSGTYDLKIVAYLECNVTDVEIYGLDVPCIRNELIEFVENKSFQINNEAFNEIKNEEKRVMALSTCLSNDNHSRIIVIVEICDWV